MVQRIPVGTYINVVRSPQHRLAPLILQVQLVNRDDWWTCVTLTHRTSGNLVYRSAMVKPQRFIFQPVTGPQHSGCLISAGVCLSGLMSSQTEFNTFGSRVGIKTVALTVDQIPSHHRHAINGLVAYVVLPAAITGPII